MYQFFVESNQIIGEEIKIVGKDVNHIKNVLRMKEGDRVAISDGCDGKEYICELLDLDKDYILTKVCVVYEDEAELPIKIYLFQGLPKADKMELIIQKAVELGVFQIIPVSMKRCVVKLDEKKAIAKQSRWQSIAEAAAKQSKRKVIPQIHEILTFNEALKKAQGMEVKLIPYELAQNMKKTREIIEGTKGGNCVAIFIGPEGGFSEEEIHQAMEENVEPITLGKRILRTETAGFTILSWYVYQFE